MEPHVSVVTLEVREPDQATLSHGQGLGRPIRQAQGPWASCTLGNGSTFLARAAGPGRGARAAE